METFSLKDGYLR